MNGERSDNHGYPQDWRIHSAAPAGKRAHAGEPERAPERHPQAVSNWERGETLPDTALLPDLALILETSVDALLGGGSPNWRFRRRVTVAQMREAIDCIERLRVLLGTDHFMYRTMIDALDQRMNSAIEPAFSDALIRDVYIREALIHCVRAGDYVDAGDLMQNIRSEARKAYTLRVLRACGIR